MTNSSSNDVYMAVALAALALCYMALFMNKNTYKHIIAGDSKLNNFLANISFKNLDCWKNNNSMHGVANAARPALCISVWDDPVCTKESIRYDWFDESPLWMLVETEKGSHCAFYEDHLLLKSWMNEVAMQYLNGIRQFELQQRQ